MKRKDLTNQRFERLLVLQPTKREGSWRTYWVCRCDCGKELAVLTNSLLRGATTSCGCRNNEVRGNANRTHGLKNTSEYVAWRNAKNRCYNVKNNQYHLYGARGISMCDRWIHSFATFIADMGRKPSAGHSMDRIDPNGNYEPANCRWATPTQQANNQRANRRVTVNGRTQTVAEWAREIGMKHATLWARLFVQHMPPEQAVTAGLGPGKKM